jgi:MarR family transcriptional regulator for hemolysin
MDPRVKRPSTRRRREALPVGRQLALTAKAVTRAFDTALVQAGGSLPTWLVLSALERDRWRTQHDLALALGIEGPTLTRHLDALERAGLIARTRGVADRRAMRVEATKEGRVLYKKLLDAAIDFDRGLRAGFSARELALLGELLERLKQNLGAEGAVAPRQM